MGEVQVRKRNFDKDLTNKKKMKVQGTQTRIIENQNILKQYARKRQTFCGIVGFMVGKKTFIGNNNY